MSCSYINRLLDKQCTREALPGLSCCAEHVTKEELGAALLILASEVQELIKLAIRRERAECAQIAGVYSEEARKEIRGRACKDSGSHSFVGNTCVTCGDKRLRLVRALSEKEPA